MLDITLGATAESYLGVVEGRHPATIQLSTSMLAPARGGELIRGEARVDGSSRTVTFVSGRLASGDRTLITASAVFRNPAPQRTPPVVA
jgi:acyl-coenzyme A thioesterase PaaI-like protein